MQKIEAGIQYLLLKKRLFGEILQRVIRRSTVDIPTMAIEYTTKGISLLYNPHFVNSLTGPEIASILEHECHHIIGDHVGRSVPILTGQGAGHSALNLCQDVAINQWIPELPKEFKKFNKDGTSIMEDRSDSSDYGSPRKYRPCTLETFRELLPPGTKVEEKQPFEYYFRLLKETDSIKKINTSIEAMERPIRTVDTHLPGEEIDEESKKAIHSRTIKAAERATKEATGKDLKSVGYLPGHLVDIISSIGKVPKDWRRDLSSFVARTSSVVQETSRSRRNRRQRKDVPLIPGSRNTLVLRLLIVVDTSASMSEEVLAQVAAESKKLSEMGVYMCLIEVDTEINSIREYTGETKLEIHGRGGTCFNPVFKLVKDKKFIKKWGIFDGLLYFTDGGCSESPEELINPKIPVLWCMTDGMSMPSCGFGRETKVVVKNK